MKTKVLAKSVSFSALALILSLAFSSLYSQADPTREILVYFSDGVQRAPVGQPAKVISTVVQAMLSRFNVRASQITSAFPDFNESNLIQKTPDGRLIGMANLGRIFRVQVPTGVERNHLIDSIKTIPGVLFAEPNGTAEPLVVPNDSYFSYQWALQAGGGTGTIHAPEAWDIYTGSSSNYIAIIDYGVDGTHPDLSGKVIGDAPINVFHGTHTAGIAAANTNNSTGVSGVDWNARIISKTIENCDVVAIANRIMDAVNYGPNVSVLNNSWELDPGLGFSNTLRFAFTYAYNHNRVAVAAMDDHGNAGPIYPAAYGQGIIAVGATDNQDVIASFSEPGSWASVTAPGVHIASTYRYGNNFYNQQYVLDQNYQYKDGTSMAAPFVTGIASLLKGYNPNLSNDDIQQIIQLSADKVSGMNGQNWTSQYGYGRVNARKALDYLRTPYSFNQRVESGGTTYQTIYYVGNFYGLPGAPDGVYYGNRVEVRKTVTFPQHYLSTVGVWCSGAMSNGYNWSPNNTNYCLNYCQIVPGTLTSTGATLQTWVYQISLQDGRFAGWYPCSPQNATFFYSTLGIPCSFSASISGPSYGPCNTGTWTANVTGCYPPYTYQWYRMWTCGGASPQSQGNIIPNVGCGMWASVGTTNPLQLYWCGGNGYLRVDVTDAQNHVVSAQYYVTGAGGGGPQANRGNDEAQFTGGLPKEYSVSSFPNPFNPSTTISYQLVENARVRLEVYDMMGRLITSLAQGEKNAGSHSAVWKGTDESGRSVASGVYLYRFWAQPLSGHNAYLTSGKLLLTK